jgi:hypothetical protein
MLLNTDEEYLATELRRINWLQHVARVRRLSPRVINGGIVLALVGGFLDPVLGSIGMVTCFICLDHLAPCLARNTIVIQSFQISVTGIAKQLQIQKVGER